MSRPMAERHQRLPMAERMTAAHRLRVLLRRDWTVPGWMVPIAIIACGLVL